MPPSNDVTCPLPDVCACKACTGAELLPPPGERPWTWTTLAASARKEDNKLPNQGGREVTTVEARGCPTSELGRRERLSRFLHRGRALGALLTKPTPRGGHRQMPRGKSSGCRHGLIPTPAMRQHHQGLHGALVRRLFLSAWRLVCVAGETLAAGVLGGGA